MAGLALRAGAWFGLLVVACNLALVYLVIPATLSMPGTLAATRDRTSLTMYGATVIAGLIAGIAVGRAGRGRSVGVMLLGGVIGAGLAFAVLFLLPVILGGSVPVGPVATHAIAAVLALCTGSLLGRIASKGRPTARSAWAILLASLVALGQAGPARAAAPSDLVGDGDCTLDALAGSFDAGVSVAGWAGGAEFAFDASRHPRDAWTLAVTVGIEAGRTWDFGFPLIIGLSVGTMGTVIVGNTYEFKSTKALEDAIRRAVTRMAEMTTMPAAMVMANPGLGENLLATLPVPTETEFGFGGKVEVSGSAPILASALSLVPPAAAGDSLGDLIDGLQHFQGSFDAGSGFFVRATDPGNRDPVVTDPTELAFGWKADVAGSASLAPVGSRSGVAGNGTTAVEIAFTRELPEDLSSAVGELLGSLPIDLLSGWYPSTLTLRATARGAELRGAGVIWPGFDASIILAPALSVEAHVDTEVGVQMDSVARVAEVGSTDVVAAIAVVLVDLLAQLRDADGRPVVEPVADGDRKRALKVLAANAAGFVTASGVSRVAVGGSGGIGLGIDVGVELAADMEVRRLLAAERLDDGRATMNPGGCRP